MYKLFRLQSALFTTFPASPSCNSETQVFDIFSFYNQKFKMSHGQPRRPQNPVKYGDIFSVFGDLARRPVAKEDAAMMQTAETTVFGQTQKGGPAAVMQSAADHNKKAGLVGHRDVTDIAGDEGVTVIETAVPGARVVTESVGGQVSLCV